LAQAINRLSTLDKKRKSVVDLIYSLTLLKEQVVVYPDVTTSYLIGMKTPAILVKFLNRFANILVVLDLYTHVLFQPSSPSFPAMPLDDSAIRFCPMLDMHKP
jgi:hypothetical protein